ncbi:hypothetical protein SAMN02745133_00972 [Desulforamulus putei DSM 12395]|uniref:Uncharacterized protein n=1 Tax=Desulforamulus putei DSM 12395 TaxID=1121429 RepID=A0A1M4VRM4_9FIRM|nr:hypothetical protein SAMN02745133_00972 [Desulforamulus putei DSM 12395]
MEECISCEPNENLLLGEQRCICKKLICEIKNNVIEIKCNKCKRFIRIITKGIDDIQIT